MGLIRKFIWVVTAIIMIFVVIQLLKFFQFDLLEFTWVNFERLLDNINPFRNVTQ